VKPPAPWQPPESGPDGWAIIPLDGNDPRPLAALRLLAGLSQGEAAALLYGENTPETRPSVSKPELRGLAPSLATFAERARAYDLEVEVRVRKKSTEPTKKSP
jgi:hypothetical protein